MRSKAPAIANLASLTAADGTLFGATVLGSDHNAFGRVLMGLYNRKGVFGNLEDSAPELRAILAEHFADVQLTTHGTVAVFTAGRPRHSLPAT